MYGTGGINGRSSFTKRVTVPPQEERAMAIRWPTLGENLVKFRHVVSEICEQFAMFVFSTTPFLESRGSCPLAYRMSVPIAHVSLDYYWNGNGNDMFRIM